MSRRRVLAAGGVGLLVVGTLLVLFSRRDADTSAVRVVDSTSTSSTTTSTSETTTTLDEPTTTASTSPSTTTRPSSATTAPAPPFEASIVPVTAADLGVTWRDGCPVAIEDLRAINTMFWGYEGSARRGGRIVVHAAEADRVLIVLRDLYAARFPIQRMEPIDKYGGDDQASMRANNTSGFNCRFVAGTSKWSEHAFGRAIDVNPLMNPYVKGSSVDPPEGAPYADRRRRDQGMVHGGDAAVRAFAAQGWSWGGYWSGGKDYQHFSASGR